MHRSTLDGTASRAKILPCLVAQVKKKKHRSIFGLLLPGMFRITYLYREVIAPVPLAPDGGDTPRGDRGCPGYTDRELGSLKEEVGGEWFALNQRFCVTRFLMLWCNLVRVLGAMCWAIVGGFAVVDLFVVPLGCQRAIVDLRMFCRCGYCRVQW